MAARLGSPRSISFRAACVPDVAAPPETATIGVRTEHVRIRKSVNGSAVGRVKWIEHLGDQNHLHVMIAETEVVTLCDRDAGLAVGDAVDVDLTAPLFFSASGERLRPQQRNDAHERRPAKRLLEAVTGTVIEHADELTALDQAIGDGDHGAQHATRCGCGVGTARGSRSEAAAGGPQDRRPHAHHESRRGVRALVWNALHHAGQELPPSPGHDDAVRAMGAAIAAVKKIGRSDVGQKTMLDVLSRCTKNSPRAETCCCRACGNVPRRRRTRRCRCKPPRVAHRFWERDRSDTWILARARHR